MKKIIVILAAAVILAISLSGCKTKENDMGYEQISQEDAKKIMDGQEDIVILDVRTQEEFADRHIVGAVCIPNETIDEKITEQIPDKDQLILVYCRSGNRSRQASNKLVKLGYTNIKEFGGINTWRYETE